MTGGNLNTVRETCPTATVYTVRVNNRHDISSPAEELLASQDGLCLTQHITYTIRFRRFERVIPPPPWRYNAELNDCSVV